MLRNYLKITLRNLQRQKGYTFINVSGLAVGMTACILIGLWVQHELSYDDFHAKAERIYRVVLDYKSLHGQQEKRSITQAVLTHVIQMEGTVPAVKAAIRLRPKRALLGSNQHHFYEEDIYLADPAVLTAFTFPLKHGDAPSALQQPQSVVLSAEAARRYFPNDENPVGRTLMFEDKKVTLTVTGVLEPIPATSQLQFDVLISISTFEHDDGCCMFWRNWTNYSTLTYVLLHEGASRTQATAQLNRLLHQRSGETMDRLNYTAHYRLEPLTKVHLYSEYGGPGASGNITNVYVFSIIALFILGIACVNYMNLATAQSTKRAREVGVRKTVGAGRFGLATRFLIEALLLSAIAGLLALCLASLTLPAFETLAGKSLSLQPGIWSILVGIGVILLVGLLSGAYPALVLSRYQPARVLRGAFGIAGRSAALRKGLVVFQFAVAIALIAGTSVVFWQLQYMRQQDLGFEMTSEKGQIMVINFGGDEEVRSHLQAVKQQLEQHPDVTGVAASGTVPGAGSTMGAGGVLERRNEQVERAHVLLRPVSYDFIDLYGMNIVAGRSFSRAHATDSAGAYILNETAVQIHGFLTPEEAIGREARFWGQEGTVVGVVEDFHGIGLQTKIRPMALLLRPSWSNRLSLRMRTDNLQQTIDELRALWEEIVPQRPFDYSFLDESFEAQYRAEMRFGQIFGVAAGLAIFVACLGLFGLAAFAAEQRTKEIGIRKVLGATVPNIVTLLSKDFLKLVGIALVIATPIAYFVMQRWLENFAYRIELGIGVFLLAGGIAIVIALLTVSYQSIKAALANPADSLRYE